MMVWCVLGEGKRKKREDRKNARREERMKDVRREEEAGDCRGW